MAAIAAADLDARLAGREVDLVVEHGHVGRRRACRNVATFWTLSPEEFM